MRPPYTLQPERGPGRASEEESVAGRKRRQDGCAADEARREREEENSLCDPLLFLLLLSFKLFTFIYFIVLGESPREDLPHSEGPVHSPLHATGSVHSHATYYLSIICSHSSTNEV